MEVYLNWWNGLIFLSVNHLVGWSLHVGWQRNLRLKKGEVFALNDEMKPRLYGNIEAFAEKLRSMGYADVRIIDTAEEVFGSHRRAALMMLGYSRMLVGRK